MSQKVDNVRIIDIHEVSPPIELHEEFPITETATNTVLEARHDTHNILHGEDDRLLVVVGPCSVHDVDAAMEYCSRLQKMREELSDDLLIIMRVYFEKPRTRIGWKGLINDPDLDKSFKINKGLRTARKLLLDLAEQGMPAATEYLDLISPQYISDLVAWAAIGARTTESQGHRELASGVSCPIGFKNGTYGNTNIAIDAVAAASRPHQFLSVTKEGKSAIFSTSGNEDCHVILRGGREPNYEAEHVEAAAAELIKAELPPYLMIDLSHANSRKDHKRQPIVAENVAEQLAAGGKYVAGVMIESHLVEGNQNAEKCEPSELTYGQSITDACIGWDDTEKVLRQLAQAVKARRASLNS